MAGTAKVLGLLVYIGFGVIALRRGRTRRIRASACIALAAAAYVVRWRLPVRPRWGSPAHGDGPVCRESLPDSKPAAGAKR